MKSRIPMRDFYLTNQAIYNMLKKRGEEAGIREFYPHDLTTWQIQNGTRINTGLYLKMGEKSLYPHSSALVRVQSSETVR
jgi:hypothetical protein